jgi:SsrA-binding protein
MTGEKVLITNKKAFRDYVIEAKYEAGVELRGTEVKSLRQDGGNLTDSHARIENGEVFLYHFNINPYQFGNINNHDPKRKKKLLLHKNEIRRLTTKIEERGYTLLPLKIYFKNGKVKVEVGLGKGKKMYDKREDIKKKDADRTIEQAMKQRSRE